MQKYRLKRERERGGALPIVRFKHECVWSCHLGTDDAEEFGRHLAQCDYIQPGVREAARKAIAAGKPVCVDPPRAPETERPGQQELSGMPKSGVLVRPKRS